LPLVSNYVKILLTTFNRRAKLNQAQEIKKYILSNVAAHPFNIVSVAATEFGVSRTTVLRHINYLVIAEKLIKTGSTKQTLYTLANAMEQNFNFKLNGAFDEYHIFNKYILSAIKPYINDKSFEICEYVITEMLNNAKDHAEGNKITIAFKIAQSQISFIILDNGIGIFKKLQNFHNFNDEREAMLQLSKGKLTSDPANHTGEGIFFSSRAVDTFEIRANNFAFLRDNNIKDWSLHQTNTTAGTEIKFIITRQTSRSLKDLFITYQEEDTLKFNKTEILINLAQEHGDRLISRSQAKRITANLDDFAKVTLDFTKVHIVGQGFVDQIFRVFQTQRPELIITYINANEDVEFMLKRSTG
jgi:anti-sigma regulatory factor (Ser/Thr protein kinase)